VYVLVEPEALDGVQTRGEAQAGRRNAPRAWTRAAGTARCPHASAEAFAVGHHLDLQGQPLADRGFHEHSTSSSMLVTRSGSAVVRCRTMRLAERAAPAGAGSGPALAPGRTAGFACGDSHARIAPATAIITAATATDPRHPRRARGHSGRCGGGGHVLIGQVHHLLDLAQIADFAAQGLVAGDLLRQARRSSGQNSPSTKALRISSLGLSRFHGSSLPRSDLCKPVFAIHLQQLRASAADGPG
jgi:hypothetical protein